jgi:hypothetical protein
MGVVVENKPPKNEAVSPVPKEFLQRRMRTDFINRLPTKVYEMRPSGEEVVLIRRADGWVFNIGRVRVSVRDTCALLEIYCITQQFGNVEPDVFKYRVPIGSFAREADQMSSVLPSLQLAIDANQVLDRSLRRVVRIVVRVPVRTTRQNATEVSENSRRREVKARLKLR